MCRLHNGGLHQDGSVLRLVGGKEAVASSSGSGSGSKCQVSSVKCKRTGVVLRRYLLVKFPPTSKKTERYRPDRRM